MSPETSSATSRRDFLTTSAAVTAGAVTLNLGSAVYAAGNELLKVGLIGCGGRGTGAAINALNADLQVQLYAMADTFADRLDSSLATIRREMKNHPEKVAVAPERCFTGFDGYKKVIECCDVVLLCTPPGFRPLHLRAAVEAKKHVFCEKPVAVDPTGVRSVIESAEIAKKNNTSLLCGFCYRYEFAKRETVRRIHDGQIGDVMILHVSYNTGGIWHRGFNDKWSDMEYQLRNWYYFTWLSGDHIVEQHCHNIDKACWVLKEEYPIAATAVGGRQVRTDSKKYGNIYDHFAVVFEYENGKKVFSNCRQIPGAANEVSDYVYGTKGRAILMGAKSEDSHQILSDKVWKFSGKNSDMYDQEHIELFAAIRAGKPINDGVQSAYSTLMAIMGREAAYTGRRLTWKQMLASKQDLMPKTLEWGPMPVAPVPMPGITKFV